MRRIQWLCCTRATSALLLAATPMTLGEAGEQRPEAPAARVAAELAPKGTVSSKDGTRIAYASAGKGPVVILVSAALSDRRPTGKLGALLAERFTVVQYDRRGRGESGDAETYAPEREVEDLEALIDAAGGKAALFGTSSGAVLALEAGARLAGKVTKLALHEPPFIVDDGRAPVAADLVARVRELLASGRRGDAVALFMSEAVEVPGELVEQMRSMPMWSGMEALAHTLPYDLGLMGSTQGGGPLPQKRWTGASMQTLVLAGGASPPWMHSGARQLVGCLPNARLLVLEGADHSVAIMAPQAITPALSEFLGS